MEDEDKIDSTGTFVHDGEMTRKLNTLRTISQPECVTVDSDTLRVTSRLKSGLADDSTTRIKVRQAMAILEEMTEGTTVLHRYQPEVAPVSWMQRVLAWLRKT
jgi:hypothetical protein